MNINELAKAVNGEFVSNKAQAVVDGKHVTLGFLSGTEWVFTPEGRDLETLLSNMAALVEEVEAEAPVKNKGGRPRLNKE